MSLSVIIPTCGRPNLEYTVQSVLNQLHPGDECIVVGPRQPEILELKYDVRDDLLRWVPFENGGYDPVTLRAHKQSPGYPSGGPERDAGRAAAKNTHIMVIDDDDILIGGALDAVRQHIAAQPGLSVGIFRMRYGCKKQWRSPYAKDLGIPWTRGCEEWNLVLWGEPILELGNVGSAMCVFPNDDRLQWHKSAPGGAENISEDYWVVRNYVTLTKIRPVFIPTVIGIIKPHPDEIATVLGIAPPPIHYAPQDKWDGTP